MGIKFHCPNGHKLNVKAFLAGKKAVCPKCGQKVLVPQQSESPESPGNGPAHTTGAAQPFTASAAPIIITTTPKTESVQPAQTFQPNVGQTLSPQPIVPQPTITAQPIVAPVGGQPTVGVTDAISEAPSAVWYVRPPSGGQFGPAAGDIMRGWLAEGRVTGDSLVWRAGWPEWRSAASTFPQLGGGAPLGGAPISVAPVAPVSVVPSAPVMVSPGGQMAPIMPAGLPMGQVIGAPVFQESISGSYEDSIARPRRRRQKAADATMIVSGILVALVLVLFIILGVVLYRQSQEAVPETPEKPKTKPAAAAAEKPVRKSKPKAAAAPDVAPLETTEDPGAGPNGPDDEEMSE